MARGNRWTTIAVVGSLAGVLAFAGAPAPARAADRAEEDLIRRGVDSRRQRDDAKALELFKQAYELHHHARPAAQMGLAEIALGRWLDAEAHLREALDDPLDDWIHKNESTLRKSLASVREHIGGLEVLGGPDGAEIVIEGVVAGRLPLHRPIRVRAGEVRFDMTAPGYEPVTRSLQVAAGGLARETVNLSRALAAPVAAASPPPPEAAPPAKIEAAPSAPATTTAAAEPPPVARATPRASSDGAGNGSGARIAGVIIGVAGVAVVGAGVAFGLSAKSYGENATKRATFDPEVDSTGHRLETLQWIGYGVGAALIVAGVTTYVLGADHGGGGGGDDEASAKVAIAPTAGGAIAGFTGRF